MYTNAIVGATRRGGTVRVFTALALTLAGALAFAPSLTGPTRRTESERMAGRPLPECTACLVKAEAAEPATAAADLYGAIAYSKSTGNSGIGYNFATRSGAEARAMQRCGASDCRICVWVRNGCCALAVGDGGRYGWSYRYGNFAYSEARRRAMNECNARTTNCRIVAWACTDR